MWRSFTALQQWKLPHEFNFGETDRRGVFHDGISNFSFVIFHYSQASLNWVTSFGVLRTRRHNPEALNLKCRRHDSLQNSQRNSVFVKLDYGQDLCFCFVPNYFLIYKFTNLTSKIMAFYGNSL
jgi:hypothetical protein